MSRRIPSTIDRRPSNGYRKRAPGSRTVRRQELQRERRKKTRRMVVASWLLATVLIVAITLLQQLITHRKPKVEKNVAKQVPTQEAWLLIGTLESDTSGEANWLNVFAYDSKKKESFAMYLPTSTLVEIPGHGQESLSKALSYGRVPLEVSTVSNLLGIGFDHYLRISDQSARAFIDKIGGIEMDIQTRLTETGSDGRVRTIFAEGKQSLNGERASEYMKFTDNTGDEISRATRHATVWSAIISKFRGKAGGLKLGKQLEDSKDLIETDATPPELTSFFDRFQSVEEGALVFNTLPVKATGVDTGKQFYGVDRESLDQMVDRYLKNARPAGAAKHGRRVELLNGNGRPGIGQDVADRLIPKGFRIILNQNAKNFDYANTQIVVYSNSKTALATADEIRKILGVGEILISRQSQTLVDVTIVVGKDFIGR